MSAVGAIERVVPGVGMLRRYQPAWLGKDVTAGLILTALLVPQGMAYAELAGLPPITGLYTPILCLIGYAVFGPSKVLVLGPDFVPRADDRGVRRSRWSPPTGIPARRSPTHRSWR